MLLLEWLRTAGAQPESRPDLQLQCGLDALCRLLGLAEVGQHLRRGRETVIQNQLPGHVDSPQSGGGQ